MPTNNQNINFLYGLQSKFDTIKDSLDLNTMYFITDTQRLFVGDTEYTRPVQYGSALPEEFMPANSLFVKTVGTGRELYFSKDGESWELISVLPATITGGVFGTATKVPKVTVDDRGHITAIEEVAITFPSVTVPVQSVKSGDKVLALTGTELSSTVGLTYDTAGKKINLTGIGGAIIASVDATAFIKDGMVDSVAFDPDTKTLTITFNTDAGKEAIDVDLASLVDTYTAGNGIAITGTAISAKLDPTTETFLTVGTAGIKLVGVQTAIDNATSGKVDKTTKVGITGAVTGAAVALDGETVNISTTTVDGTKVTGIVPQAGKTTGTLTAGSKKFDGSANVTITKADLGVVESDTTYEFANGTDGSFTVTPSDGEAQKVTVGKPATAGTADKLATARAITLTGDAIGTANFDGSAPASIAVTVNDSAHADEADHATAADSATTAGSATTATTAATASKVANALTINGVAYDGSSAKTVDTALKWGTF